MIEADAPRSPADWLSRLTHSVAVLASGLLVGGLTIFVSVSLAALIFTGALAGHLERGVEMALISATLVGLIVSIAGSGAFTIAIPQDRTAPILAMMAASIVAAAPAGTNADQLFLGVLAAIVGTTLIVGIVLLSLGLGRAGDLMRFFPYSVLGGFLAGTGWLLVLGAMRMMSGMELNSAAELAALMAPHQIVHWMPGLVIAGALLLASRKANLAITLPLLLLGATATFYAVMLNNGESLASLSATGWLLGTFDPAESAIIRPGDSGILPGSAQLLAQANWSVVPSQWDGILTVLLISAVSIMLTASGMEMLSRNDVDVNRELRVAGIANVATGLSGGMVGFQSLSLSSLALKMGGKTRVVGVIAALTCGAVLWFGTDLIVYLPRGILGGLLLFLGLSLLGGWLIGTWGKLPHGEYLVIPLILVVIATMGFLEGMLTGLLAAVILFVINYSRTPIVRYALSGKEMKSRLARTVDHERYLHEHGDQLLVLKLRGHLFFGTANQLLKRIQERADDSGSPCLRYVLIDFRQVTGIDSSAMYSFLRLHRMAGQKGFRVLLTDLAQRFQERLHVQELVEAEGIFQTFADQDHGLEWYENQVLDRFGPVLLRVSPSILERLSEHFSDQTAVDAFRNYLFKIAFSKGQTLITQGEPAGDLFFLEQGGVSVYLRTSEGPVIRIQRMGPGTVVGEMGFYLDTLRSASVIADDDGSAYRLTREALDRMEKEHPEFAMILHRFIADLLAERLHRTMRTVEAVMH